MIISNSFLVNISSDVLEIGTEKVNPGDRIALEKKDAQTKGLLLRFYQDGKLIVQDSEGNKIENLIHVPEEIHNETIQENEDGELIEVIEVTKVTRTYDLVLHELNNIL